MSTPVQDRTRHHLYIAFERTGDNRLPFQTIHLVPCDSNREVKEVFRRYAGRSDIAIGNVRFLTPGEHRQPPTFGTSAKTPEPSLWHLRLTIWQSDKDREDPYSLPTSLSDKHSSEAAAVNGLENYNRGLYYSRGSVLSALIAPPEASGVDPIVIVNPLLGLGQ